MKHIHMSTFRLHAHCPKCKEYRSSIIMTDGKDRIILVCGCEGEEKSDAEVTPRWQAESLIH